MNALKIDVAALAERLPEPDEPGKASKFTGPKPEDARKMCDEILEGGRESVLELVGLARDAADPEFKNYKAAYLLHALVLQVGAPEREAQRKLVAEAMASHLGSEKLSKATKSLLIRELQAAGSKDAAPAIGKLLLDEDLCDDAALALAAIRDGAAEELRAALPQAAGRCRLAIVQALGAVADAASAGALRAALADGSREVRIAAAWGLARIADPAAADGLFKASNSKDGWERTQAIKACLLYAENLAALGKKAEAAAVYTFLRDTQFDEKDRYIREAAERGLAALKIA